MKTISSFPNKLDTRTHTLSISERFFNTVLLKSGCGQPRHVMSDRAVCDLIPLVHRKGASLPGRRHTDFVKTEGSAERAQENFLLD